MRRIARVILVAFSVLGVSGLGWLWWRSLSRIEGIEWNKQWIEGTAEKQRIVSFRSGNGVAYVGLSLREAKASTNQWNDWHTYELSPTAKRNVIPFWQRRFGYDHIGTRGISESYILAAPHWVWAMLAAGPAAIVFIQWLRRRRRVEMAICPECGYDLPATPDRCPECGTAAAERRAPSSVAGSFTTDQ